MSELKEFYFASGDYSVRVDTLDNPDFNGVITNFYYLLDMNLLNCSEELVQILVFN